MQQFYEKVLPDRGRYCVASINNGVVKTSFLDNKNEIDGLVESLNDVEGNNVYFTPGVYEGDRRNQKECLQVRALFLDIDCKGRDKRNNYDNKKEGLAQTLGFIEKIGLPEGLIIDSGYGLHFYWPFVEAVDAKDWVSTAKLFKSVCSAHGLVFDPAVPADSARLMRCPATNNKQRKSKLLADAEPNPFEKLKEVINAAAEVLGINTQQAAPLEGFIRAELDETTKSFLEGKRGDFETSFKKILKLGSDGCSQINEAFLNQDKIEEPLWRAVLSVAHACTDGEKAIHWVSSKHPDYSPEATQRKADGTSGPYGCKAFESVNPGGCDGCVNRGKIDNPIKLHKELKPPEPQGTRQRDPFPPDMFPFFRAPNAGIYKKMMGKKGKKDEPDEPDEDVLIFPFDLEVTRRYLARDLGEVIDIEVYLPNDASRSMQLQLSRLTSKDLFQKDLGTLGVTATISNWMNLMEYTRKWAEYLQKTTSAKLLRSQLGWSSDLSSFAHGGIEYFKDGTSSPLPVTSVTREVSRLQTAGGTYEGWQQAFQHFNEPGFELHAFIALAGFGSVLCKIHPGHGAVINAYNKDSGTGKTIAMYGALSLWGAPKSLFIKDSTANGRIQRVAVQNSIPFGMDETTNIPDYEMSELIYTCQIGTPKIRMSSNANTERTNFDPFACITIMTANSNVYVKLNDHRKGAQGEMARVLQFQINPPNGIKMPLIHPVLNQLNHNFGWAGPKFIQFVIKEQAEVKSRLQDRMSRFEKDFGSDSKHRFYGSLSTDVFAAADLANELKIIKFDIPRIYDHTLEAIAGVSKITDSVVKKSYDILQDFINENYNGMLSVNSDADARSGTDFIPGRTPMGNKGLIIRHEHDKNMVYILKSAMDAYLDANNHTLREFEENLGKAEIFKGYKRMQLAKGWRNGPQLLANAYIFNFKIEEDALKVNDLDEEP